MTAERTLCRKCGGVIALTRHGWGHEVRYDQRFYPTHYPAPIARTALDANATPATGAVPSSAGRG